MSILVFSMLVVMPFAASVKADPKIIYVDAGNTAGPWDGTLGHPYRNITSALGHASVNDTVYVYNGIYHESNIKLKDNLSLIGENKYNTIIDGGGNGWILNATFRHGVTISGFTIQNSPYGTAGILLHFSTNNIIRNNIIKNHESGVYSFYSCGNLIEDNLVTNNYEGIILSTGCKGNTIRNNNVINNTFYVSIGRLGAGVDLTDGARDNEVEKNNIIQNPYGISIMNESNSIFGNQITENGVGIYDYREPSQPPEPTYGYKIFHNNFINNTKQTDLSNQSINIWDDGYPSGGNYWSSYTGVDVYSGPYQNVTGKDGIGDTPHIINGNNRDRYPLMNLWSPLPVHNINTGLGYATIQEAINANETLNGHVIFVDAGTYVEHVVVNKSISLIGADKFNTVIDGNYIGNVMNITASNVKITGFAIQKSGAVYANCGIYLGEGTTGNNVSCNIIINNYIGIQFEHSSNNTLSVNSAANNQYGIDLNYSSSNRIYHNNFINNIQVENTESNNTWDDGARGNYWDNYGKLDTDGDGIGNTPYVIDANNRDRYPLVVPLGSIPLVWDETIYPVELKSNSTISRFQFKASQKIISFNVTGLNGTIGFCNLTTPNILVQDLWQNNFAVLVDGKEPILMKNWTDGTYTYIYFTYLHAEHEVTIVPEFPTWASLLLILIVLTLAIVIYKRRLLKHQSTKQLSSLYS
jgi:parallel beta-helix repeat protein